MSGVMGVDPSLTSTGLAHWSHDTRWSLELVTSTGKATATFDDTARRLERIVASVRAVREQWQPDLVVFEVPSRSATMGHTTDRAGLFWLLVQDARKDWPSCAVAYVWPNVRIRYALGKGSGTKDAVLAAAIKRYPEADISNNNTADAVLLADLGAQWLSDQPGFPAELRTAARPNQACLDAVKKVQWPGSLKA